MPYPILKFENILFALHFKVLYMEPKKYLDDLNEIKDLMNRSSRFMSLSGLSGILAGVYALIGAGLAYFISIPRDGDFLVLNSYRFKLLLLILFLVALLSILTAYLLSRNKAKKNKEKIWTDTTKRLLISFLIPLLTGGIYIIIKLSSQHYGLTASLMLIFYGLALVNASKFTLSNIKFLGYSQIVVGLLCAALPGYGLYFWALGFGVFHIIYGARIYFKYDRN